MMAVRKNPYAGPSTFGAPVRPSGVDTPLRFDMAKPLPKSEVIMARDRVAATARWSHKNEGTPETHEQASRKSQGSLARMFMAGDLTADQLAWAVDIADVAERIESDVAVRVVSYEPRIDCQASGRDTLVEGIRRVRLEMAYSWWRQRIEDPKRAILDMLTGEPKSFSAVARLYRTHKRSMRKKLFHAIDLWPEALKYAELEVDDASLAAAHAGLI